MRGKEIKPKVKSESQALSSLMALCARAERSSGDARRLMMRWGVDSAAADRVLAKLIAERFIDDSRYAQLYLREKINLNGWGSRKISAELYRKGVSREIIAQTLQGVDSEELRERLRERLSRKIPHIKYKTQYELKGKLLRHAASQGFEYGMTQEVISELLIETQEDREWDEF